MKHLIPRRSEVVALGNSTGFGEGSGGGAGRHGRGVERWEVDLGSSIPSRGRQDALFPIKASIKWPEDLQIYRFYQIKCNVIKELFIVLKND